MSAEDDRTHWVVKRRPRNRNLPWIRESRLGTFDEPTPAIETAKQMTETDAANDYAAFKIVETMETAP